MRRPRKISIQITKLISVNPACASQKELIELLLGIRDERLNALATYHFEIKKMTPAAPCIKSVRDNGGCCPHASRIKTSILGPYYDSFKRPLATYAGTHLRKCRIDEASRLTNSMWTQCGPVRVKVHLSLYCIHACLHSRLAN